MRWGAGRPGRTPGERSLLDAARGGDGGAFDRLVDPYRGELHAHCYRMLSSVHDAEDALQDALIRAWRGLPRFEGRSQVRSWLYRIATNVCLDAIGRRPKRLLPIAYGPAAEARTPPGAPLVETVWIEPYPDERLGVPDGLASPEARYERRESIELAFIAALQHLPPRQRAALVLHDVLAFSAREVGDVLDTSVASVNSALQRARKAVEERVPDQSQQVTLRALGDDRLREIVQGYVDAWERGDVEAVIGMLTTDVTWSMPPMTTWFQGTDSVAAFLTEWPGPLRWRRLPVRANGQVAIASYTWDADAGVFKAFVLDVLTLRAEGPPIEAVTAFISAGIFPRFGMPTELPA